MLKPQFFIDKLADVGIDFFAGVPDSLLKNICAYITDHLPSQQNIITANEGGAIGLAAGYHLATGKTACVYMQNSGQGNIVNPLASLTDSEVYRIPVLLLIGWRGRPGVHDEPQHVKQGKITTGLLNLMGVDYTVLSRDEQTAAQQIVYAADYMKHSNTCYALVIEKDTFEPYILQHKAQGPVLSLIREEAIRLIAADIEPDACIVSTTGMISRELFEYRAATDGRHDRDFLTVGSMGHASQIALGIALQQPLRRVYCLDGDGAAIMHMGGMAIVAQAACQNYVHIVLNNGAHDSVGGQPTVGFQLDLTAIARAMGYAAVYTVSDAHTLEECMERIKTTDGPVFLEVRVKKGNRKDLGRPTTTPVQNKEALMNFLNQQDYD